MTSSPVTSDPVTVSAAAATTTRFPELVDPTTIVLTGKHELRGRMPLFDVFAALAVAGLIVAMVAQRPELLGLAAPFVVAIAAAVAMWSPIQGSVHIGIDSPHIVEGDSINVVVHVAAAGHRLERVELELHLSERVSGQGTLRAVTTVPAGTTRRFEFPVRAKEWGIGGVDRITVRVTDRFGLFGGRLHYDTDVSIRIGLAEDRVAASLEADHFRRVVGSHLSNDRGQGLEIADIRPYLPGDSMRDINWRITNRRHEPWVTLRHPDRSATVVVIVDAHDGESGTQNKTQRRSVAAAMALTRGHLALHDPVGLLVVGHAVRWLPPTLGRNQLYRVADELIAVSNAPDASLRQYRPPAIHDIARETIVVAVSPLRDPLMVSLIAELRSRGNPVAVLVPESPNREPGRSGRLMHRVGWGRIFAQPSMVEGRATGLARRLASVEQSIGAQSLRSRGVVLVRWKSGDPVTAVIEAVTRLRKSIMRSVR